MAFSIQFHTAHKIPFLLTHHPKKGKKERNVNIKFRTLTFMRSKFRSCCMSCFNSSSCFLLSSWFPTNVNVSLQFCRRQEHSDLTITASMTYFSSLPEFSSALQPCVELPRPKKLDEQLLISGGSAALHAQLPHNEL